MTIGRTDKTVIHFYAFWNLPQQKKIVPLKIMVGHD